MEIGRCWKLQWLWGETPSSLFSTNRRPACLPRRLPCVLSLSESSLRSLASPSSFVNTTWTLSSPFLRGSWSWSAEEQLFRAPARRCDVIRRCRMPISGVARMLEVKNIHTYYGLSHILFDVSLSVTKGEIVGLLGRNGAGKSTTMRSIMGLTPAREGQVSFRGEETTRKKPFILFRKGIGYVPDDRRVFADLSVDDNLEIVYSRSEEWNKNRIYEIFPALGYMKTRRAGNLSGGEQQ